MRDLSPMSRREDIDPILSSWPFQPGVITARIVRAGDGREVLQMRIELGLLQMEAAGRPDGLRPEGETTYLDYLRTRARDSGDAFSLSEEQAGEIDREFVQFYHRRICWLALREFDRAVRDADHTLELMDFVSAHSANTEWTLSHEQYRPFVLFQRTQAAALAELERSGPEAGIEEVSRGLEQIRTVFRAVDAEEHFDQDEFVKQLVELREWIRQHYRVGRTLSEQLADAVASEEYELAARLRDEIARRQSHRPKT